MDKNVFRCTLVDATCDFENQKTKPIITIKTADDVSVNDIQDFLDNLFEGSTEKGGRPLEIKLLDVE